MPSTNQPSVPPVPDLTNVSRVALHEHMAKVGQLAQQRVVTNSSGAFPVPDREPEAWFVRLFNVLTRTR
jgi:hypothetical protein